MRFSVITPAYEARKTLGDVYSALQSQTLGDFEWIVVDDGSTDGTADLLRAWTKDDALIIKAVSQENCGKHVALNAAVEVAEGDLSVILDADDTCDPTALERMWTHWSAIPDLERQAFAGIVVRCKDEAGNATGTAFPRPVIDTTLQAMHYRHRVTAELWGCVRTDLLRAHPFPAPPRRGYVPEGIVWNRIARSHLFRFVNEALRTYRDTPDSIMKQPPMSAAEGHVILHREILNEDLRWFWSSPITFLRMAALHARYATHARRSLWIELRALDWPARLLFVSAIPIGVILAAGDRARARRRVKVTAVDASSIPS